MAKANPLWGAPKIHGELLMLGFIIGERSVSHFMPKRPPKPPWQNPYAERLVGSIRRECLDHVVVLGERHLHRILRSYFSYYHRARTHLSLGKDAPKPRAVQPSSMGDIVELPEVGGLHHRYERRAA
jgi:hypothetical protein